MPEIKDGRSSTPRRGPLAWIEGLEPSCFTFVMATGIVSEAFALSSQELLANGLFTVNLIAYPCLFAASIVRVLCFPRAVWVNLTDRRRVFGFFAFIVGTNVIGAGSALRGFGDAAFWLWVADSGLWLILIYLAFAYSACPLRPTPQALSEAVVILGACAASANGESSAPIFLTLHALWGIGLALYIIFITLFSYRFFFSG